MAPELIGVGSAGDPGYCQTTSAVAVSSRTRCTAEICGLVTLLPVNEQVVSAGIGEVTRGEAYDEAYVVVIASSLDPDFPDELFIGNVEVAVEDRWQSVDPLEDGLSASLDLPVAGAWLAILFGPEVEIDGAGVEDRVHVVDHDRSTGTARAAVVVGDGHGDRVAIRRRTRGVVVQVLMGLTEGLGPRGVGEALGSALAPVDGYCEAVQRAGVFDCPADRGRPVFVDPVTGRGYLGRQVLDGNLQYVAAHVAVVVDHADFRHVDAAVGVDVVTSDRAVHA